MRCFARVKISLILAGIIAMFMSTTGFGVTIFVDDNAWGNNDGTDWNNALRSLQDAIAIAYWLDKPVEIRVANGIYRPDQGIIATRGDREMPFFLLSGVTIKGGYAGRSYSINPNARDIERYKTILSGDLLGNDGVVDDPFNLPWAENRLDNSFSVLIAYEVDETAVLDGFTIRSGYGNEIGNCTGAGMYCENASPTVKNCVFEENFAGESSESFGAGAGMINISSNPTLRDCTFRKNCVGYQGELGTATGGGLSNLNSNPLIRNCVFDRNVSFDEGGAIDFFVSEAVIENCTFNANLTYGGGGATMCFDSEIEMTNCLFTLNTAGVGGAIDTDSSAVTMTNCTFADNLAFFGGNGFSCMSAFESPASSLDMTNCILWDGYFQIFNSDGSNITINYSDVQGGWSGSGANNVNADPLFAESGYYVHIDDPTVILVPFDPNAVVVDGDYHLKSEAGRWDPIESDWVQDDVTSPCIDLGDPTMPVGDEPEPNGGIINMGAYGGTEQASMTHE